MEKIQNNPKITNINNKYITITAKAYKTIKNINTSSYLRYI